MWGSTREKDLVWRGALVRWASVEAGPVLAFLSPMFSPGVFEVLVPLLDLLFAGLSRERSFPILNRFCSV